MKNASMVLSGRVDNGSGFDAMSFVGSGSLIVGEKAR